MLCQYSNFQSELKMLWKIFHSFFPSLNQRIVNHRLQALLNQSLIQDSTNLKQLLVKTPRKWQGMKDSMLKCSKDTLQKNVQAKMKHYGHTSINFERLAQDRTGWRREIIDGLCSRRSYGHNHLTFWNPLKT